MDVSALETYRVLPVVTPLDVPSTVRLAKALHSGGMRAIEITLRSASALESMVAVQQEVPEMTVAAGTVNTPGDLEQVAAAGVKLALSPGATPELLAAAAASDVGFIPGIATASELMRGMSYGFSVFKLFPAQVLGGQAMLKSLGGPFPQARFCPTGGLNPGNFRDYLALDNVLCCGGSWMVTSELVAGGRWDEIESLAREAMS